MIFTFQVMKIIKGRKQTKTVTINSKYNNIDFENGKEYLIYSYFSEYLLTSNFYLNGKKVNPFLATDVCTNTKKLNLVSKKELKKLAKRNKRVA